MPDVATKDTVVLDRSVQFLYEGFLAELELGALGATGIVRSEPDWRTFEVALDGCRETLVQRSAYAGTCGEEQTVYSQLLRPAYQGGEFNRTRSPNQFLTHWIYPYRGKFHPQMVRGLLNIMGARPGMVVGDFFSGSGTTALEASLLGLDFVGVDISPLCVNLALTKTESWRHLARIERLVERLGGEGQDGGQPVVPANAPEAVKRFVRVAELVATSDRDRRKRDYSKALTKNLNEMLRSVRAHAEALDRFGIRPGSVDVRLGDARDLAGAGIQASSVDVVVTSPPYSIALDYVENDEHALNALGIDVGDLRQRMTGVRGRGPKEKLGFYNMDMQAALRETAWVLSPGGMAAFVVGDATVNGREWTTTGEMLAWANDAGLEHVRTIPKIVFGLYSVMKDEQILILRKPRRSKR